MYGYYYGFGGRVFLSSTGACFKFSICLLRGFEFLGYILYAVLVILLENNVESDVNTRNILVKLLPKIGRSNDKDARKKHMKRKETLMDMPENYQSR